MSKDKLPVFVINLKTSERRRNHIKREFEKIHLSFEFIDAVDGRNIDLKNDKDVDYNAVLRWPKQLTSGMIGCCLSHAKIYREIIDRNIEVALIVEDDCVLSNQLPELIEAAKNKISPGEVILFYYSGRPWGGGGVVFSKKGAEELPLNYQLLFPYDPHKPISTAAYMIDREACKNILSAMFPIHSTPDAWGYFFDKNMIRSLRCVFPRPTDTADFKSTIDYIGVHSVLGRILRFIDNFKLFPFYQLLKYRRRKFKMRMQAFEFTDEISPVQSR